MSSARDITIQTYLDYAFQRNGDKGGLEDLAENERSLSAALKNLASSPDWSHYHEEHRITTVLPYSTGTIDLTDGDTAVDDGGSGTAWQTAGVDNTWVLKVDGEDTEYPVASVSSETALTLKYPMVNPDGSSTRTVSYKLIKREYVLPDNFRQLLSIEPATAGLKKVKNVTAGQIMAMAQRSDLGGEPDYYSIYSKSQETSKVIRFHPYPEDTYVYQYDLTYQRWPEELDFDNPTTEYVDWPPEYEGVLQKAIELEIARKNRDPQAIQSAAQALANELPNFKAGSKEDVNDFLTPFGSIGHGKGFDIQLDSTSA